MKPIDILLILALVAIVGGVICSMLLKKKKGQTGCGCSCAGCPSKGACGAIKKEEGSTHVEDYVRLSRQYLPFAHGGIFDERFGEKTWTGGGI